MTRPRASSKSSIGLHHPTRDARRSCADRASLQVVLPLLSQLEDTRDCLEERGHVATIVLASAAVADLEDLIAASSLPVSTRQRVRSVAELLSSFPLLGPAPMGRCMASSSSWAHGPGCCSSTGTTTCWIGRDRDDPGRQVGPRAHRRAVRFNPQTPNPDYVRSENTRHHHANGVLGPGCARHSQPTRTRENRNDQRVRANDFSTVGRVARAASRMPYGSCPTLLRGQENPA